MLFDSRIVIVGAGGQGKVVADALLSTYPAPDICFADDADALWGQVLLGCPVLGAVSDVLKTTDRFHIAIGNNQVRRHFFDALGTDRINTVVHPRAIVSKYSELGCGVFVAAASVVAPSAKIGTAVIINHGAVVDHDCVVGDFCHIAPNASLGGFVWVGKGVLIGAGATILPGIRIGDNAVVAAGAVVIKDVGVGELVCGVPAILKIGKQGI